MPGIVIDSSNLSTDDGITVVIATLGGSSLASTIHHLNKGTIVPNEILISIPIDESSKVESLQKGNVRVVKTNVRGQVDFDI